MPADSSRIYKRRVAALAMSLDALWSSAHVMLKVFGNAPPSAAPSDTNLVRLVLCTLLGNKRPIFASVRRGRCTRIY